MRKMPMMLAMAAAATLWCASAAQDRPQTGDAKTQTSAGTGDQAAAPASDPNVARDPNQAQPRRKPFQDDILKALLTEQELPRVIRQQDPELGTRVKIGPASAGEGALLEGTMIVERPAQFGYANEKPQLTLRLIDLNRRVTLQVLPSRLLEALEREYERGAADFVISGEITRYNEMTYILVRKVVRRVSNGNVSP